jgi:hypothetical protein
VKLLEVQTKIDRARAQLDLIKDPSKKEFEKAVRPGVPSAIDCCDFEPPDTVKTDDPNNYQKPTPPAR